MQIILWLKLINRQMLPCTSPGTLELAGQSILPYQSKSTVIVFMEKGYDYTELSKTIQQTGPVSFSSAFMLCPLSMTGSEWLPHNLGGVESDFMVYVGDPVSLYCTADLPATFWRTQLVFHRDPDMQHDWATRWGWSGPREVVSGMIDNSFHMESGENVSWTMRMIDRY